MVSVPGWFRLGFAFAGGILVIMVGLLFFVAISIAMRPILIVGTILAVSGIVVAASFSPRIREWLETAAEPGHTCKGLRLADDVASHPTHSWARITSQDVVVGADDLVQATLGPVEAVDLPPKGTRVEQGDRLFSLRRGNRTVVVRSPVSGAVVTRNEALLDHPELVNEAPFVDGWAVRLRADNVREERQRLFEGRLARVWLRQEIDRLTEALLSREAIECALPDGGTLVEDLYRQIDDDAWKRVSETLFAAGPG